jgi:glutamine synthetase
MSSEKKFKLEYVWLDGYLPEPNLRSKTKVVDTAPTSVADLPLWGFDGSSTQQAEGKSSDCVLKPVALYPDSTRKNGFLVMCEVCCQTANLTHPTSDAPSKIPMIFGSVSSKSISSTQMVGRSRFPEDGFPAPQGPYYTAIGYKNVGDVARIIVEEHIDICFGCRYQSRRHQC